MTVRIAQPAINLRERLAQIPKTRLVHPRRVDFANLVKNGGFGTDTVWVKGTGWTISGGVANAAGGTSDGQYLSQTPPWIIGRRYAFSMVTGGTLSGTNYFVPRFGGAVDYANVTAAGTYATAFTLAEQGLLNLRSEASSNNLTLDNIHLYEADPTDNAPWFRLPHGMAVGTVGWIVRDGVTLHPSDYTEITLLGQTWIKPLVAPTTETEFSIWCVPEDQA